MKGSEHTMLLYFTGTGNSEYDALRIAKETREDLLLMGLKWRSIGQSGGSNPANHFPNPSLR